MAEGGRGVGEKSKEGMGEGRRDTGGGELRGVREEE